MSALEWSVALPPSVPASVAAQAQISDIAWNDEGWFECRVTVAPGTFAEMCGRLRRADAVA